MNNQRSKEIKVGAVAITSILILFFGIILGKGFNLNSQKELLKIRFPNSGGIQVGEPVVVNGVKRGSIRSVDNNNGTVLVTVSLSDFSDIKSDAIANITILEITGGKKIEIFPGVSSQTFSLSNEMPGKTPADLPELVRLVGEVSGDAVNLVRRLDTIATSATTLLADGKVISDIRTTVNNTTEITNTLKVLINDNQKKIEQTLSNLHQLTLDLKSIVNKNEPKLTMIVDKIDSTINQARDLLTKANSAITDADTLLKNVNDITKEVKYGKGLISKAIYDKEFSSKLDSAMTNLFNLVDQIKQYGINVNVRLGSNP